MTATGGRTILLGEDDLDVRRYLATTLRCDGYRVELAQDGEEVLACLESGEPPISAVLLDIIMPRKDGLETLKEIRRTNRDLPVIMVSGAASAENVLEAMKGGCSDFMLKPVNPGNLRKALQSALGNGQKEPERVEHPRLEPGKQVFLNSATASMLELQTLISQIGWSEAPVLIQGETGVGKEVFARELHAQSPRAKKPFLKLNCAALPSELVESELFGYERGAFTGAFQKKPGFFELANGGTLLLDEIGDMDFKLQAKLLQVLQDQEFQRLGGKETISVNVRIIAATHQDLIDAIGRNDFREDLYHRLNVFGFRIPPLRERKADIIPLAEFLIQKHTPPGSAPYIFPQIIKELLLAYDWPGNVRELENVTRQSIVLRDTELISHNLRVRMERWPHGAPPAVPVAIAEHDHNPVPSAIPAFAEAPALHSTAKVLEEVAKAKLEAERAAIVATLRSTRWNRRQAAYLLNIDYKALLYKMKKLAIKKEQVAKAGFVNATPEALP
jgi:two-component system response regulator AtoC